MLSLLQYLGYVTKNFEEAERALFIEAWSLIVQNNHLNDDRCMTSLSNLTTLLVAIDKIYIPMVVSGMITKRKFGAMTQAG